MSDTPGTILTGLLDSAYKGKPIRIVETGCMRDLGTMAEYSDGWSTLYIARWVAKHPGCKFESCDIDANAIELAHAALEAGNLAKYCTFRRQDSLKFLTGITWLDIAFLDSCDGLQHGLDEFRLAASAGASLVIGDDYTTKFLWAAKEARTLGWEFSSAGRYSVLRRHE